MASAGLWMLVALGALTVASGLPVWALLVGVASAFALGGLAAGAFGSAVLFTVPGRLLNLLDHDLLQAMPLYVFIGVLLQRLPLGDALFACGRRLLRGTGAAPSLSALAVGALVAPMNGSVAASSALLSRLVGPQLAAMPPARAITLASVAATIGVVVPPSLVLILLGDAMLRAHTEASNLPGYTQGTQRIVNTQDVLHAALLPACAVLLLWAVVAWWQGRVVAQASAGAQADPARASGAPRSAQPTSREWLLAAAATLGIFALLAGVFTGRLFAVEAAATGACVLVACTLAWRALGAAQWSSVLQDTLALSGALFALLVGATTFSLVFRLFGTDRWLAAAVLGSPWPPLATAAVVLAGTALCAWVLDAFEMIFVIIPIVAPLLVVQMGDAQQVAVLLLLVLQASFLLPPLGYAVLMARAQSKLPPVRTRDLVPALAPFIAAQLLVLVAVFSWPSAVHHLDAAAAAPSAAPSEDEVTRQMLEMSKPVEDEKK
ncbi:TRAP transporter large permease subunit [Ramlibacter albus]|uniref:TRAP transporter large permease subunit n=1 Tax=Ramlibacter albus TaxID=2079448 RepID=A0A923S4N8_9BURK|nr:TRAP transporter large permease subunit [Ramlibacter albus]MBC5767794.1 TRAP transporter large permease subunit [Ramlibacter albus]